MEMANNEDEYGAVARLFHWTIAVLIIGLLPVGLFMGGMENSPFKFQIYALHKSFGLLVLFLGVGRLVWRFLSPPPDHLESHRSWERALAGAAHFWLYVCIFGMPLSGWLMSSAGQFPIPFFGLQMPNLIGKDEHLGDLFYEIHEILAYTLLFVLALHMAGALKHHIFDHDETLARMTLKRPGMVVPAVIILFAGASYAVSGYIIAGHMLRKNAETAGRDNAAVTAGTQNLPSVDVLPEHGWAIMPSESKLEFQASLYKAKFTGTFKDFTGTIIFDPDNLDASRVDIRINMKDVQTGDADRDQNIVGPEWFDSDKYPESRYEATQFEKGEGNNYVAIGTLTIRDVTMPLILSFTLDIVENKAHVTGATDLNRVNYGIGTGQWEGEDAVGHDVEVQIDLHAIRRG